MNAVLIKMHAGLLALLPQDLHARLRRWRSIREVSRWLRAAGWPGIVGLSLIVFALAFYVSAIRPAQEELARQQELASSLRDGIQHAARAFSATPRDPAQQLVAFYRFFPAATEAPETLRRVYEAARAQDLVLDQGEYRLLPEQSDKLVRYQVTLPVKGPYPQIQRFLAAVLTENPVVSLEDISFEKQRVADRVVGARIRLAVYLRKET